MNGTLLLQTLAKHHTSPPASESKIVEWEKLHGLALPEALKGIYRFSNGVQMGVADDPSFILHPIEEVEPISIAVYGEPPGESGPPTMFGLIRLHDGDYAALDLTVRSTSDTYRIVDAFTETIHFEWRNPKVIAASIEEFFLNADQHLAGPSSYWWLKG